MPQWVLVVLLAIGCDLLVIYNQFISLSGTDQIIIVCMIVLIFMYCALRLKFGKKVNFKSRKDAKNEITRLDEMQDQDA